MTYLFCAYRDWTIDLYKLLSKRCKNMVLLKNPKKLTLNYVKKINPKFIFFPDWSWAKAFDPKMLKKQTIPIHDLK